MINMLRCIFAVTMFVLAAPAAAQWQVPLHSVPIGLGGGMTGFGNAAPGPAGQWMRSTGPNSDPSFQPYYGPATNVKAVDYQIQTSDCNGTVQVGTGSTGMKTITLPAVSGFPESCAVTIVNGDNNDGKKEVGFPTGFSNGQNILWPRQAGAVQVINGAWATTRAPGRWKTPAALTLYSNSGGNNTFDCLATGAARACASAQHALYVACNEFDFSGLDSGQTILTVQLDNNDTQGIHYSCRTQVGSQGGAPIVVQGSSPSVVLSGTSADAIGVFVDAIVQVRNITLATSIGGACITADLHAQLYVLDAVTFNACAVAAMNVGNGADIYVLNNYAVNGSTLYHMLAQNGGRISTNGTVVASLGANVTVTGWVLSAQQAGVNVPNWTMNLNGFTVTGQRSQTTNLGLIFTGLGTVACTNTYFPGNSNGATSGGGQCL